MNEVAGDTTAPEREPEQEPTDSLKAGALPIILLVLAALALLAALVGLSDAQSDFNIKYAPEKIAPGWMLFYAGLGTSLFLWVASDIVASLRVISHRHAGIFS